jgi:hypothetical protein
MPRARRSGRAPTRLEPAPAPTGSNASSDELTAGLNAVQREGAGVLQVAVYRCSDLPQLKALVRPDNDYALALHVIGAALAEHDASRDCRKAAQCFCCGGGVDIPAAVVLVTGYTSSPQQAIAGLICSGCDGPHEELRERIATVWREQIDRTARRIDIHPAAGRA